MSQSHNAGLFVFEGCTGCGSAWSRSNMAAISVPSRGARLETFSINRADGRFVFFLFGFESTCLGHVSYVEKNVAKKQP